MSEGQLGTMFFFLSAGRVTLLHATVFLLVICHFLSVHLGTGLETESWGLVRNSWSELLERRSPTITFSLAVINETDIEAASASGPVQFSKAPIINGPLKLCLFTCKIEVSIVLHLT